MPLKIKKSITDDPSGLNGMSRSEMYEAIRLRNSEYDGVFFSGVKTTGIFCRPTCPARTPNASNVCFFSSTADALAAGFRPCQRCRPMEVAGRMPSWLEAVVKATEKEPSRKWQDTDIRQLGVDPKRVRRWFQANHGITFHAFLRSRRLSTALSQLSLGMEMSQVALSAGYESLSGFRDAFEQWFGCPAGQVGRGGRNEVERLEIFLNRVATPLGPMIIAADSTRLYLLEFADRSMLEIQFQRLNRLFSASLVPGESLIMDQTCQQLDEYFTGNRTRFELPLEIRGSEFQEAVWHQLTQIPYGETVSYETIARRMGNPGAQRAVGKANGDNRLAVVIPCHRVIRSNGELSGYGGGVRRKEWMIRHEASVIGNAEKLPTVADIESEPEMPLFEHFNAN